MNFDFVNCGLPISAPPALLIDAECDSSCYGGSSSRASDMMKRRKVKQIRESLSFHNVEQSRVTRSRDLGVVELMRLHEGLVCLNYTAKAWTEPGTVTRRRTLSLCYHYPCSLRLAGLFQPALMPFFASSPPAAHPFGRQLLLSVSLSNLTVTAHSSPVSLFLIQSSRSSSSPDFATSSTVLS